MNDKKPTEPKAEAKDSTLAEAIKIVAAEMIPAAVASAVAAVNAQNRAAAPAGPRVSATNVNSVRCTECGQYESACEKKHTMMVVYPTTFGEAADFFTGIVLNGVRYLSNDPGHKVLVPENAASTISNMVAAFEQNEKDQLMGRKATHRSGGVGNFKPANHAWR